jgi:hypothetical protein
MTDRKMLVCLLAALAALAVAACSKKRDDAAAGPGSVETGLPTVDAVMPHYEECRVALAADKTEIGSCARSLAAAARTARETAPAGLDPHLAQLADAATRLAAASGGDPAALRTAYSEVSKPIVALIEAVPEAVAKYHVFECPMADGYNRWAQIQHAMANPYMGTRMPECGKEITSH